MLLVLSLVDIQNKCGDEKIFWGRKNMLKGTFGKFG